MKKLIAYLVYFSLGIASGWIFTNKNHTAQFFHFLENAHIKIFNHYDKKLAEGWKDSFAKSIPEIFAYPYFCQIFRISPQNSSIESIIGGQKSVLLKAKAVIKPGYILETESQHLEIHCADLKITVYPNTKLIFSRNHRSKKTIDILGNAFVSAKKSTEFNYQIAYGKLKFLLAKESQIRINTNKDIPEINLARGLVELDWQFIAAKAKPVAEGFMKINNFTKKDVAISKNINTAISKTFLKPKNALELIDTGQASRMTPVDPTAPNQTLATVDANMQQEQLNSMHIKLVPSLIIKNLPNKNAKTDVKFEWQAGDSDLKLPCKLLFSQDKNLDKILAQYESKTMNLRLKNMRLGTYFWQINCTFGDETYTSEIGKVSLVL